MKKLVLLLCASISFASYGMETAEARSIDKGARIVAAMKWQIENNSPEKGTLPDDDYANAWDDYQQMLREVQAEWDDPIKRNKMEADLLAYDAADRERALQLLNDIEAINKRLRIKDQPGRENKVGNWMRGILNPAPAPELISSASLRAPRNGRKVVTIVAVAAICYGIYRGYQWWKSDKNKQHSPNPVE